MSDEKVLTKEIAEQLFADDYYVEFSEFTAIDDEAAEILGRCEFSLYLSGLPSLSDAAAESLGRHQGDIELRGLTELSDAAAKSLSQNQGLLDLRGLTNLSDAAAESLSRHKGNLWLSGLTELSDAAVESLSKHEGNLGLSGLTTLSDAAAESFSKHEGDLNLNSLTSLSEAAAQGLGRHKGDLHLDSLVELSDTAAESLSKVEGRVHIYGVKTITAGTGHLSLIRSCVEHTVEELALSASEISDEAIAILSKLEHPLELMELTALSDSAAELFRTRGRSLIMPELVEVSPKAAASLAALCNLCDVAEETCHFDVDNWSGGAARAFDTARVVGADEEEGPLIKVACRKCGMSETFYLRIYYMEPWEGYDGELAESGWQRFEDGWCCESCVDNG